MKPDPEEIDIATYRRLATKQPRKAKQRPRVDIPRAETQERDGLTTMIKRGWNVQSPDCVRYRLYRDGLDTGLCESAAAAVIRAKELTCPSND